MWRFSGVGNMSSWICLLIIFGHDFVTTYFGEVPVRADVDSATARAVWRRTRRSLGAEWHVGAANLVLLAVSRHRRSDRKCGLAERASQSGRQPPAATPEVLHQLVERHERARVSFNADVTAAITHHVVMQYFTLQYHTVQHYIVQSNQIKSNVDLYSALSKNL